MAKIPCKVTVRLDFTNRDKLMKFMDRNPNRSVSLIIRKALRRFLDDEEALIMSDSRIQPSGDAGVSDTSTPADPSMIEKITAAAAKTLPRGRQKGAK